jgi:hypothetical protein
VRSIGWDVKRLRSWSGEGFETLGLRQLHDVGRVHWGVEWWSVWFVVWGHAVLFVVGLAMGSWVVVTSLRVVHVLSGSLIRALRVALAAVLAAIPPVLHSVVAASF